MIVEPAQAPLRALPSGARVHLVGVAGAGMNALAAVLLARGYRVSGSDMQHTDQVDRLAAQGMAFAHGHAAEHVRGADLLIISAAVREENVELAAARAAGIPVVKRAAALGWLLRDLRTIAVAGTHGKTTTTAMLAVILRHAGLDPTFAVGGEVLDLGASAHWGAGAWAVVEADEYDRSFLQLRPEIAVITNVEPDHLEYYGSVAGMHEAYAQFIARIRPGGALVLNMNDPYLRSMPLPTGPRVVTCALADDPRAHGTVPFMQHAASATDHTSGRGRRGAAMRLQSQAGSSEESHAGKQPATPAIWRAVDVEERADGVRFTLTRSEGDGVGLRVHSPLAGRHNVANAVQAIAAAALADIAPDVAGEALAGFHGTGRRFQPVGEAAGVLVIDDYAHHPTEVRANLAAARARFPGRRLIAVFQPHTYSRTKLLFDDFVLAFDDADLLLLTDIYPARETETLGMDAVQLRAAIAARAGSPPALLVRDLADVPAALAPRLRAGDVVLTLGAGTITSVGPRLLDALRQESGA